MKRTTIVILTVLVCALFLSADIYIKEKEHTEAYLDKPAGDRESELWAGTDRAAYITPAAIFIYNKKLQKAWVANPKEKTYVEVDIPLDISKYLTPEAVAQRQSYKSTGTVERTGETRTVLDKKCTAFNVDYWIEVNGTKLSESKGTVWVYEDIAADFAVFDELLDLVRRVYNRDEVLCKSLQKMRGPQMRIELVQTRQGTSIASLTEAIEFTIKDPTAGIYEVSQGYTKKDTF